MQWSPLSTTLVSQINSIKMNLFASLLARRAILLRWRDTAPPTHSQWLRGVMSSLRLQRKVSKSFKNREIIRCGKRLMDCHDFLLKQAVCQPILLSWPTIRHTLRADRTADYSGKTGGGGLCIYVNKTWCTNSVGIGRHCSPNPVSQ